MKEELKIYNIGDETKKFAYIRNNTNAFKGINEKDIKQVESNYFNDVYVLLDDGSLYFNGNFLTNNIDRMWMHDGFCLFMITINNEIKPLQKWTSFSRYLSNNNCQYKKIITNTLNLVALTNEGRVIATTINPSGFGIIPENFMNVDDICIIKDEPHIIKKNKKILLYVGDMEEINGDMENE